MSRFYLRLILIPTALFTVVLILIHAQPYDDHELRELLLPEGCPAPCFMGIRPGVTTKDEALKILRSSVWVHDLTHYCIYPDCKADGYEITWSDKAPSWINREVSSKLMTWDTNIISEFFIMTTDELQFFDVYYTNFGSLTSVLKIMPVSEAGGTYWKKAIGINASQYKFRFMSRLSLSVCLQNLNDFLALPISVITIGDDIKYGADYSGESPASLGDVVVSQYC